MISKSRHIRIFISSTFRDMQAERDYLIKYTFPELRKRCRERGLELTEVDLRWGVTREQAENGEVLPICLKEIENSRPYFIGLLGERYGWVPPIDQIEPSVLEKEQWIKEHLDKSVTEMEILHGVLNHPEMAEKAYFYFRDPAFLKSLKKDEAGEFQESDPELQQKLQTLKQRIKTSGFRVEENYKSVEDLGKYIAEDLWKSIDADYPESEIPDPLDKEAMEHEQFGESRRKVYIGRQEYFKRLDAHANGTDIPLVVKGESGSGKTALVANWVGRYRKNHPDILLIQHYIGSSVHSTDHLQVMTRVMSELKRAFSIPNELPTEKKEIEEAFTGWLHLAAAKGKVVLVLDGLNQLEDKDNARALYWLPKVVPANIRLLVSVLPGETDEALKRKNWQEFTVQGLQADERKSLINEYLGQYTKKLDALQVKVLIDAEQTQNPMYLKVLLDELRVFGVYEQINDRIAHYLSAQKPDDLYELILVRLEQDYEQQHPGFVGQALANIYVSRFGLTEKELLGILGNQGNPMPQMYWSPVYLALEEALVSRNGLLNFFHDYMRKAVYDKYIQTPVREKQLHKALGDYFEKQELSERKALELPWQYMQAESWGSLYAQLLIPALFNKICRNVYDIKIYWSKIEANTGHSLEDAWEVFKKKKDSLDQNAIWNMTILLREFGYNQVAIEINDFLISLYEDSGQHFLRYDTYNEQAVVFMRINKFKEALALLAQVEKFAVENKNNSLIVRSRLNQASIYRSWSQTEKAFAYLDNVTDYAKSVNDKIVLLSTLVTRSAILSDEFKYEEALEFIEESLTLSEELDRKEDICKILANKSNVLTELGQYDLSLEALTRAEEIANALGNKEVIHLCMGGRAKLLQQTKNTIEALQVYKNLELELNLCGDKEKLQMVLQNYSLLLMEIDKLDEAYSYLRKQETVCVENGFRISLMSCNLNQASILFMMEKTDEASQKAQEAYQLALEFGNEIIAAKSLMLQGQFCKEQGKFKEILDIVPTAEQLATKHNKKELLLQVLHLYGLALQKTGNSSGALSKSQKGIALAEELKNTDLLQQCLLVSGDSLLAKKQYDKAMEVFQVHEKNCERMQYPFELERSYTGKGKAHIGLDNCEEAIVCFLNANSRYLSYEVDEDDYPYYLENSLELIKVLNTQERYLESVKTIDETVVVSQSKEDQLAHAKLMFLKASVYRKLKLPDAAKEILKDAYTVSYENKYAVETLLVIDELTYVYFLLNDIEPAKECLEQSKALYNEFGYVPTEFHKYVEKEVTKYSSGKHQHKVYRNRATEMFNKRKYRKALRLYEEQAYYHKQNDSSFALADSLGMQAHIHYRKGNVSKSILNIIKINH